MAMDDVERELLALLAEDEALRGGPKDEPAADLSAPLSAAQRNIWFLQQYDRLSTAYNLDRVFLVEGEFDVDAFRRALQHVCERHEILRTRIVEDQGRLSQVVDDAFQLPLTVEQHAADEAWSQTIVDFTRRHVGRPFDLGTAPPVRAALRECGDGRTLIALAMHHVLSDAWSNRIWLNEIALAYDAFRERRAPSGLPTLPLQYRHYALRQRDYLASAQYGADVAYWRQYLGAGTDALALPQTSEGTDARTGYHRFSLTDSACAGLAAWCSRARAGQFAALLGLWQVLLGKLSNQSSFQVGVPASGRLWPDVEHLIGCFVNTHVYRAALAATQTLDDVIQAVQRASIEAMNHGNVPFDALVAELGVKRTADENPLFQVLFDFKVADAGEMAFGEAAVSSVPLPAAGRKFDLTLSITSSAQTVQLEFEYAAHRFDGATVERWAQAYGALLDALLADARQPIGALDVLDAMDRDALLALSRVDERYEERRPVHCVIAEQAMATPDAVALEFGERALSYRELDAQANRLAHRLIALGVRPEVRVGIAVERSVEMVVGLLAILKAGGAYVPLDPEYPRERLAYMIEDSGIALLLTQARVRDALPVPAALDVLELDTLDLSMEPATDPAVPVDVENLAYVIYTSGSTGRPKGAANRHGALTNRLVWMQHAYGLDASDTVLQKTPFSFDVSVWEFFWPLMSGAKLAVAQPGDHRDPARLVALVERHGVTTLHFVPSMLQAFVAHADAARCTGLKRIVCSGEALPADLAERALSLLPGAGLYNLYGPTEAAIDVTHWTCVTGGGSVPIGRPIANVQTYVLDGALNLAPRGVAGELYLGGAGLARGYLDRAALTAERFVPDPFGREGERLYRTGDLARWNAEGALDYLGRIDHQVKIRGFRIELGEIEAQLAAQAGVREAVVTAQDGAGGTRLVAYATARAEAALDVAILRAALAQTLPDYMVPGVIMVLEAMPLNPNGKVDRKALPQPEIESAGEYEAPEGETETAIAAIWREVLGITRVGRHDNFFELGGDSILSLQIVARLREAGWKITPRQLFERQTVALLASVAQRAQASTVEAVSEEGAVPLLPIQAWFFDTPMAHRAHWNQAVLLEGPQAPDPDALRAALEALVAHHGALRLRFEQEDGQGTWHQTYATDDVSSQDLLWEREAADASQIGALCDEAQRSLNLTEGPLLRALLIRLPQGAWRLLLAIHHLAVDGVSWRILLDDLQQAYEQASTHGPVTLPSNGTTYQAWAKRLAEHAQNAQVRDELPYWQSVLATPSALPVDDPQGANTVHEQQTATFALDRDTTHRLLHEVPAAYRTQINDVLLTALGRALCSWTVEESIRIDLEGHGREDLFDDIDLSRTVGWFTSLYPVKLEACGEPGAALKRVKETLRAVPQRGLGFGLLKYAGAEEDRTALTDATPSAVVFNYLGQFDGSFTAQTGWRPAAGSAGQALDPQASLTHALTINARIYDGALTMSISYSGARHREATVEALLHACMAELEALIAHCTSGATGATPSDFPLASLTQAELDALPMPASAIEDLYPLSPMQAGMLFHTLYAPGGSAYLNQLRIDIDDLDVVRFRAAWEAATAQHTILRTGFVQQGEGWLQWVAREAPLPFMLHDWADRSDHTEALDTLAAHDLAQGFDLARPPLQRVTLVRTAAQRHHLIWTHHHVLMDGWSVSQLMGDVLRHYDGRAPVTASGRYRDYIDWLARRDAAASETYWRGVLAELDEPTRLATALGNADPQPGHGEHLLALDEASTTRLIAFARACRVTVNTLVQAAWSLVLQRSTSQRSVVFGATVAGRPDDLPGASRLLGLFINTVPVVSVPREGARLGEWLHALQAQSVASQEHAHTPLYEIQRWSGAGAQGLFDTLLVFENYPVDEALKESAPGGLTFGALTFREETNYALTLGVTLGERLLVSASHARAQFDAGTVKRLLAQLERALARFATLGASACLGEVSLLDEQEHETLLALGRNDFSPAQTMPVHAQIQARALATPQATALVLDDISLSYGELEAKANRLAHRLIAVGVKPEVRVGIAVERSLDMVIGLLAILKAGGAYVPLDPEYPRERLAYMMEDSGIALLLTQTTLRDQLPVPAQLQVVDLDTQDVSTEPSTAPEAKIHDDTLAYVIYTSGSTGRPKGVAVAHGALAMHCHAIGERYALTPQDRLLQFASISFDAAQEQWLIPLLAGAALVLRGRELWSTSRLGDALKTQGVSVLYLPPAYVDEFARSVGGGEVTVGTCIVGGEAWSHAGFEAVRERLRAQRIFNAYGPAETVITPTVWEAGAASRVAGAYAPVGRPVGARRAYVLDASLNLVPQGATGELYLGGAGLARGYLNRAGLTADRFVPDPFDANGGRLYRTGDLVRWNAQGELEYVSRIDHQVKIRGFRVEPGEIEALLRAQPSVREAVVTAQAAAGGARLVAYATPQAGESLDAPALRDALAAALPDYMVPARVVVLDALPLSPNGKVDRAALPALELQSAVHEPPQGDDEAALAAIWREVLGVERVGRNDTFFELGGHSLLALQAQRRIQRQLSVEIPLPVFFSHATLRDIAASSLSSRHAAAQAKASAVTDMQALLDELVN